MSHRLSPSTRRGIARWRLAAFPFLSLALYACSESLAPREQVPPFDQRFSASSTSDSFEVFTAVIAGTGVARMSAALPAFPDSTMVEFSSSGFITAVGPNSGQIGPWGQYNSYYGCLKNSLIRYASGVTTFNCNGLMSTGTASRVVILQGNGIAELGPGNSHDCATLNGCSHSYSGERAYQLRVPRPVLHLESSDTVVTTQVDPDTVRFFATWSPTHLGTTAIPARLMKWRWKSDSSAQESDITGQCLPPLVAFTCKIRLVESGVLSVEMRLNGRTKTEELAVFVDCPPSDSLISPWEIRKGLADALTRAKTANAEEFLVITHSTMASGSWYTVAPYPGLGADECRSGVPDPAVVDSQLGPWEVLIAFAHTHIHRPDTRYYCTSQGDTVTSPLGAGVADWDTKFVMDSVLTRQIPHIVIDPENVFVLRNGGVEGDELALTASGTVPKNRFIRLGCGWPK